VRIVIMLKSIRRVCWCRSSEQGFSGHWGFSGLGGHVGFGGFVKQGGQPDSCGFGAKLAILLIKEIRHIGKPFYQMR
jgi:hypothetical protein